MICVPIFCKSLNLLWILRTFLILKAIHCLLRFDMRFALLSSMWLMSQKRDIASSAPSIFRFRMWTKFFEWLSVKRLFMIKKVSSAIYNNAIISLISPTFYGWKVFLSAINKWSQFGLYFFYFLITFINYLSNLHRILWKCRRSFFYD